MKLCSGVSVPARDDRLMLMEELEPGPYEHKPPFDDPLFGRFEPHSGIRLVYVASFLSYQHHRLWSFLFFSVILYFQKGMSSKQLEFIGLAICRTRTCRLT